MRINSQLTEGCLLYNKNVILLRLLSLLVSTTSNGSHGLLQEEWVSFAGSCVLHDPRLDIQCFCHAARSQHPEAFNTPSFPPSTQPPWNVLRRAPPPTSTCSRSLASAPEPPCRHASLCCLHSRPGATRSLRSGFLTLFIYLRPGIVSSRNKHTNICLAE
jgi:hypothetical protein